MKLMDKDGRLFGLVSIVDVLVVAVVAVLAVSLYVKAQKPHTSAVVENTPITYQMLLMNQPKYVVDAIREGDQMFDKDRTTNGSLGTITDIQVTDGTRQAEFSDGTLAVVPSTGWYNILLTIEGSGLVSEGGNYSLNRIYEIGVNSSRNFNTKYASFVGTITSIQ